MTPRSHRPARRSPRAHRMANRRSKKTQPPHVRIDGAIGVENIASLVVVAVHEHRDPLVRHRLQKSDGRYDRAMTGVQVELRISSVVENSVADQKSFRQLTTNIVGIEPSCTVVIVQTDHRHDWRLRIASCVGYPANAAISTVVSMNAGITRTEHPAPVHPCPARHARTCWSPG